jgi:aerobic carbon-monoxide dehydrogenase large subunit
MARKYFGTPVKRTEDPRLITGKGRYVDDIDVVNMKHAAFLRSPHAHAKIISIDTSAASDMPGVHLILTQDDLGDDLKNKRMSPDAPPGMLKQPINQYPLARGEVHMVGQTVALIVADNRHIAEDAAALIMVDYEPLEAIIDFRKALNKDAPLAHSDMEDNLVGVIASSFGDVEQVFADADHVIKVDTQTHRGGCHATECRSVLVDYNNPNDGITIYTASQAPFMVRRAVADYLGEDESLIRVIAPDVGGGFGPKGNIYPEDIVLTIAAHQLGGAIKWTEDRREHFTATSVQGDQNWSIEIAATKDGKILGLRGEILVDMGAHLCNGFVLPLTTLYLPLSGPYTIVCLDFKLTGVYTNKTPTSPVRGAGRPNANFAFERAIDAVARKLGLDAAEIRYRNLIKKDQFPYATGAKMPHGQPVVYDSGNLEGALDIARRLSDYDDFKTRQQEARKQGCYLGIGIASGIEDTGFGPYEGAKVKVQPSGKVQLSLGASSQGQGHETVFSQIVADELGVDIGDITFKAADTATTPLGVATVASRVTVSAGPATQAAARDVRAKAIALAAQQLDIAEDQLDIEDGIVKPRDPKKSNVGVSLSELASALEPLMGGGVPPGFTPALEATSYETSSSMPYASSANIAEVEVDISTGEVRVVRYSVAHDCGNMINPMLVDGQIIGGVVHGIGNALFERMYYDDTGQPLSTNYGEYLLPMASEMPHIDIEHQQTPSPNNNLGVKGAGEGGTIPAASAVIAAIENALEPFGVIINEHPVSPPRICELIDEAQAQA